MYRLVKPDRHDPDQMWEVYQDQRWLAAFRNEALALYFMRLLDTDPLLAHLLHAG